MLQHLKASWLAVALLSALVCKADVDPDADPDRAPRVRPATARSVSLASSAEGDYAYDYGEVSLALFSLAPPQTFGCRGGNAFGFSLDASNSIVPVEFGEMQAEVAQFIFESDEPTAPARSLYYANTFGTFLGDTTEDVAPGSPSLDPNVDSAVSNAVLSFSPRQGGGNIAAGLQDLTAQFTALADPAYAPIAVLVTDSSASPAAPLAAAVSELKAATRVALGTDVTVVVVGVGDFVDAAELTQIASTGADGTDLVFQVDFFDDIGLNLETALSNIDSDGDGVSDCNDGCPTDPDKTEPGRCGCGVSDEECPSGCRGSFGFSLATNVCFGNTAFDAVLAEVIEFIEETSGFPAGAANPNLYYVNAVHHSVHSTTGLFDRNTDGDIAAAVLRDITFTPGGIDIAAGLNDLRVRFGAGMAEDATGARIAFVVTDGFDGPASVNVAAQALRASGVTVVAVAPPGMVDTANLEAIASTPELVVQVTDLAGLAQQLLELVAGIDSDSDGTPDCEDSCPADPNKVVPGICGCGEVDQSPCT
eukprot:jgi/Ulvmu1/7703/UM039_0009.1